jgi:hypothetical protein
MLSPLKERGLCSPSAQRMASTRLLFPLPFGPIITLIPGSKCRTVFSAKDLKPLTLSSFKYNLFPPNAT